MNEDSTRQEPRETLIRALKQILRPLVRLLIHHHITFPSLRDLLKSIYVDVAREIIEKDGNQPNHSRIYILTGVHRKDIKRLHSEPVEDQAASAGVSLGGELIARWTGLPEFLDEDGVPRALERTGSEERPGFEQLVTSASKDIRPRAMLDEWLRQGLVSIHDDRIVLNQQAFVPSADFGNLCYYLGRNVRDHLSSSVHNLLQPDEPMLERSVYYGELSAESVAQLRESATAAAQRLLGDINRQAMQLHRTDAGRDDANHRFTLGCYWYQQDDEG